MDWTMVGDEKALKRWLKRNFIYAPPMAREYPCYVASRIAADESGYADYLYARDLELMAAKLRARVKQEKV